MMVVTQKRAQMEGYLIVAIAISAAWSVLWTTSRQGLGLMPDSASYLSAARSFAGGDGFLSVPSAQSADPYTKYAPFYPMVLGVLEMLTKNVIETARYFQALLMGGTVLMVGCIVRKCCEGTLLGLLGAVLIAMSPVMLQVHSTLMSEALFIILGIGGLIVLARNLSAKKSGAGILVAAVLIGLAYATRYAGAALVAAGFLSIMILSEHSLLKRMRRAILFSFVSVSPMLLWGLRNRLLLGSSTFEYGFYPQIKTTLWEILAYWSGWLLPYSMPRFVRVICLMIGLFLFASLIYIYLRKRSAVTVGDASIRNFQSMPTVMLIFCCSHIGIYLAASILIGRISVDNRGLSPVFVATILSALPIAYNVLGGQNRLRSIKVAACFVAVVLCGSYVVRGGFWLSESHRAGLGYSAVEWQESETLEWLTSVPKETILYTNGPDVVYLLKNRGVNPIPAIKNLYTEHMPEISDKQNKQYGSALAQMGVSMKEKGALVVMLDGIHWRHYYATASQIGQEIPMKIMRKFSDGTVWSYATSDATGQAIG